MSYSQYFTNAISHTLPSTCYPDTTPPSGGAIASIANNTDGSIRVTWPAASDSSVPIRYRVFLQASTATGLFNSLNQVFEGPGLLFDIYRDASGNPITNGVTYYAGVRAVDAVGNVNTNTTSLSVLATGISYDNLAGLINTVKALILTRS